ncbi:MAG TPA: hypothetical protein VKY19_14630 [Ktedonosporobacter sp.]|jgi:hypothetical protein|nr:hypothetical protein [Ktedonosporobacter sp.]
MFPFSSKEPDREQAERERLVAQKGLGALQKTYARNHESIVRPIVWFGLGVVFFPFGCLVFWRGLQEHDSLGIVGLLTILTSLGLLWAGFYFLRSLRKKNRLLQKQPDAIFLYEHELVSHQWREAGKNTWKRELYVLRWNEVQSLQSQTTHNQGYSEFSFWIKTRYGDKVDLSLGKEELAKYLEQRI